MALFLKQLVLLSLLLFFYSALQTQARDSQFFSKEVRYNTPEETEPTARPEGKKEPIATQMKPNQIPDSENHRGLGLYGHDNLSYGSTLTAEYTPSKEVYSSAESAETGRYEVGDVSMDDADPIEMYEKNESYYRSRDKSKP